MDLIDTSVRISTRERTLVSIDRFRIPDQQIMFLFGESGIGKSLIAKAIFGLLETDHLTVTLAGLPYADYLHTEQARNIRQRGFFVFQEPSSHLNPLMTIGSQLREGVLAHTAGEQEILAGLWQQESRPAINNVLSVYPRPYRPSGGEKQRVLVAMAFKKIHLTGSATDGDAGLFVFDEPTGSLDDALRDQFLGALFDRFRKRPFTTLVITHDYSMISAVLALGSDIADRITFRELAFRNDSLVLRDFSPTTYTTWISSRKQKRKPAQANHVVLEVQSGVRVLGHWVLLSQDPEGISETPMKVHTGRMTYLKAPSGAGKTTFAKSMMGLLACRNLRMRLGNLLLSEHTLRSFWHNRILGRSITMVFQHADEALNQQAKVSEVFDGLPLPQRHRHTDVREFLRLLFDEDEIPHLLPRTIRTLSGGQKQKLNLLRSLILDTECVILDEPLNGLDFQSTIRVLKLLDAKRRQGTGLLVISHNGEIFDVYADDVYYLKGKQ